MESEVFVDNGTTKMRITGDFDGTAVCRKIREFAELEGLDAEQGPLVQARIGGQWIPKGQRYGVPVNRFHEDGPTQRVARIGRKWFRMPRHAHPTTARPDQKRPRSNPVVVLEPCDQFPHRRTKI
jgi:hypothetical protein